MAVKTTDHQTVPRLLRRLVLLGTPIALLGLEITHPVFSTMEELLPSADRWFVVHVIQIPLFGLMAVAVYFLVDGLLGPAATASRLGMWLFIVFYVALDAMSGVATGMQLRYANGLDVVQQTAIVNTVDSQNNDPVTILIAVLGTVGWLVGVLAAAIAIHRAGGPRLSVVLLVAAALVFSLNHEPPLGPIAFGCFFLAAARLELVPWNPAPEG